MCAMNDLPKTTSDEAPAAVVMGAFVRVDDARTTAACDGLRALPGVTVFALDAAGKVGLLVEAGSLEEAHLQLTRDVAATDGVLGVWPVSVELDDPSPESASPFAAATPQPASPTHPIP